MHVISKIGNSTARGFRLDRACIRQRQPTPHGELDQWLLTKLFFMVQIRRTIALLWPLPCPAGFLLQLGDVSSTTISLRSSANEEGADPSVTRTFWSILLKVQDTFRLVQLSHGFEPEHLIFCRLHRSQLCDVSSARHYFRVSLGHTHTFDDRFRGWRSRTIAFVCLDGD